MTLKELKEALADIHDEDAIFAVWDGVYYSEVRYVEYISEPEEYADNKGEIKRATIITVPTN